MPRKTENLLYTSSSEFATGFFGGKILKMAGISRNTPRGDAIHVEACRLLNNRALYDGGDKAVATENKIILHDEMMRTLKEAVGMDTVC